MSISFYVNHDGQLTPRPAGLSARDAVALQSPRTVWRASPWRLRYIVWPALTAALSLAGLAVVYLRR